LTFATLTRAAPLEERVLILYDARSSESVLLSTYLRWLLRTMWRIPVTMVDLNSTPLTSIPLLEGGEPVYTLILVTNIVDGVDRMGEDEWSALEEAGEKTPLVTFWKAVAIERASVIFGCRYLGDERVGRVSVRRHPLTESLPATVIYGYTASLAEPMGGKAVMMSEDGRALVVARGKHVWIGLRALLGIHSWAGPAVLVYANLPKLSPRGFIRLRLPPYASIRIDDVPFSTESWFWGWQYFTAEQWRRYFSLLKEYDAKVNLMIICYNVSKSTGEWTPYTETHGDVIEVFREAVAEGVADAQAHGATHVTPFEEYFINNPSSDPWELTLSIRFEFGYDPHTGKPIPRRLQEEHLRNLTKTIEEWFGYRPVVWTPPWHVYNDVSVKIAEELGYLYFSDGFRLTWDERGAPPCIMGEEVPGTAMICVPVNADWDHLPTNPRHLRRIVEPLVRAGIPIVFISHGRNWTIRSSTTYFTLRDNELRLRALREYGVKYLFLRELGEVFKRWRGVEMKAVLYQDRIEATIIVKKEIELCVDAWMPGTELVSLMIDNKIIKPGEPVELSKGSHELLAYFEMKERSEEGFLEENWPLVIVAIFTLVALASYVIAREFLRRT